MSKRSFEMDVEEKEMVPSRRRYMRVSRRSAKPWRQSLRISRRGNVSAKYSVHHYRRAMELTAITPGTPGRGYSFSLNQLVNAAELTVLYDSYKIYWIEVKAIPSQINAEVASVGAVVPTLFTAIDLDDATPPASYAQILEDGDHKMYQMDKMKTIARFSPRVANTVFRSGVSSAYSTPEKPLWLDCSTGDVPHYGLKVFAEPLPVGFAGIRLIATVYFAMKHTR